VVDDDQSRSVGYVNTGTRDGRWFQSQRDVYSLE